MLEDINYPKDIKRLNIEELKELAKEIRQFLISSVSKTGGHLASNLGIVELTLSMLKIFDIPKDEIVWDVGHQSYVYKILTGRRNDFENLRELGYISGFPSRKESKFDSFGTGHASTSIAAASGIACAKQILGKLDSTTIAVIGDGSLTGGLALEGLSNIANQKRKLIIVLNDNEMSIDENVGIVKYLSDIRISKQYIDLKGNISNKLDKSKIGSPIYKTIKRTKDSIKKLVFDATTIFEKFGLKYYGPIDGHDISKLCSAFKAIKNIDKPVILHVKSVKGKGYKPALDNPSKFHGVAPFDVTTGKVLKSSKKSYTEIFSDSMYNLLKNNHDVVAITAAMLSGTGLKKIQEAFPRRVFDVGIAEEYAVTFAAGMSTQNIIPVVCIYSTFLQRAYDQILHDVCIQNLPVIFAVDRAGIVGKDGATHQGLFDISYLNGLPNMNIIAPINEKELTEALSYAYELRKPVAIRYPRATVDTEFNEKFIPYCEENCFQTVVEGGDLAIIGVGTIIHECKGALEKLRELGIEAALINPRILKPINTKKLQEILNKFSKVVVVEEGILSGGFASSIIMTSKNLDVDVFSIAIDDEFVSHGEISQVRQKYGLDKDAICNKILNRWYKVEKKA